MFDFSKKFIRRIHCAFFHQKKSNVIVGLFIKTKAPTKNTKMY